eukprot:342567_1
MPKHGFMTPKAIANRIKAKGLQKLRWYCQMCHKQCRDENGFKCHCMSEGHARQMQVFSENPDSFMNEFSEDFEKGFMEILRRKRKRIKANKIYQEYISDGNHLHMNSTIWSTLSNFVQYLGRTGKAVVDKGERDWYITFIGRDPAVLARQEAVARKERLALDDEERERRRIEKQIAHAAATSIARKTEYSELKRDSENDEKLGFSLSSSSKDESSTSSKKRKVSELFSAPTNDHRSVKPKMDRKKPASALDAIMRQNESAKEMARVRREQAKKQREEAHRMDGAWLRVGLIVKVVHKSFADGKYHKQKGTILKVSRGFIAQLKMSKSGDIIKMDQPHLETVLPSLGRDVKVLKGSWEGFTAKLLSVEQETFSATMEVTHRTKVKRVSGMDYGDLCKFDASLIED